MISHRKAQGLPMQTIIIFGILIIVAFIVIFFFTGRFAFLGRTVGSCSSQGGECLYRSQGTETSCRTFDDGKRPVTITTSDCPAKHREKVNKSVGGPCCIAVG